MSKSRIKPEDSFPENLNQLEDDQVEILNSKVHRQLEVEYVEEGLPHPETENRQEEINEELDDRDLLSDVSINHPAETSSDHDDGGGETSAPQTSVPKLSPEHNPERRH